MTLSGDIQSKNLACRLLLGLRLGFTRSYLREISLNILCKYVSDVVLFTSIHIEIPENFPVYSLQMVLDEQVAEKRREKELQAERDRLEFQRAEVVRKRIEDRETLENETERHRWKELWVCLL